MSERPRLLDLFCGAGGCAVGYHRAGFDVVGVDIEPQPRYPFECIMQALLLPGNRIVTADGNEYRLRRDSRQPAVPGIQRDGIMGTFPSPATTSSALPARRLVRGSALF